jgi:hypothetical protein
LRLFMCFGLVDRDERECSVLDNHREIL